MVASAIGALLHSGMFPLYSLWSLYHKWMLNAVKKFFAKLKKSYDLFFIFNVMYHIDWFADTEPSLHPQNKFVLFIDYNMLMFC